MNTHLPSAYPVTKYFIV